MTKPDLPPCSVQHCKLAAGAIIDGALLCGQHALEEMQKRGLPRSRDAPDRRDEL
jgi:hypothetical protein